MKNRKSGFFYITYLWNMTCNILGLSEFFNSTCKKCWVSQFQKKMAGFPIFHGFPLGQQSDVVFRTVVSFQLHFFLHNLIWTDKCRQHMQIHLLKQNICPELKFSKYLIYFYLKWYIFTMNFFLIVTIWNK